MTICIIGLGLIGGSLALDLRANGFANHIIGVDANPMHGRIALQERIVDEILPLEEGVKRADLVILAIPVNAIIEQLPAVLAVLEDHVFVIDMGSTKLKIANSIEHHPRRNQVVLAHPMAGTEYSGPKAAVEGLFLKKVAIICEREKSKEEAIEMAEKLFKSLFMHLIYMDAKAHDVHTAYVSHISHISSFVLALTVLEKEKSEANIFNLASGGFASTVRLAKSSPRMWADVYEQNAGNILDVLDEYIETMQHFSNLIRENKYEETFQLMSQANKIGLILDRQHNPVS